MKKATNDSSPLARIPTGVVGLDEILRGGLFQGDAYMFMGAPGSGKTILACQMCFAHVAAGGRALYISLLSESHGRLLAHLRNFQFFHQEIVGKALSFLSGYATLGKEGLTGLLKLLRKAVSAHRATLLVIDGMLTASGFAETDVALKTFVYQLHLSMELAGCTTILLTSSGQSHERYGEQTIVDGLLELSDRTVGMRAIRELQVHKLRGEAILRGRHSFELTNAGVVVYPRVETLPWTQAPVTTDRSARLGFGVGSLDSMLSGGMYRGSTTMLFGTAGTGKTLLGLHFLAAGAAQKEPGLYCGFNESPPELLDKAKALRLELASFVERGVVEFLWEPSPDLIPDALATRLFEAVRRRKARRLFLDDLGAIERAETYPQRSVAFLSTLTRALRTLGVTTVMSDETRVFLGPEVETPGSTSASAVDNVIFLRHVELRSQLRRLISVLKMRNSAFDSSIREFVINEKGIQVAETFQSAEAILTGLARPLLPFPTPSAKQTPRSRGRRK